MKCISKTINKNHKFQIINLNINNHQVNINNKHFKIHNKHNQLVNYFHSGPSGYTPLTNTFNSVLSDNVQAIKEKKLLIICVTDGEPTNTSGDVDIKEFKKCLTNRYPIDRIFVTIVACTDEDESIDYLNKWDRQIKQIEPSWYF